MTHPIDARLDELGIALPTPPAPAANYVPFVITGNQLYVSGQLPVANGEMMTGKLGADLDVVPAELVFDVTNFDQPQQVAVTAVDDDLPEAAEIDRCGSTWIRRRPLTRASASRQTPATPDEASTLLPQLMTKLQ